MTLSIQNRKRSASQDLQIWIRSSPGRRRNCGKVGMPLNLRIKNGKSEDEFEESIGGDSVEELPLKGIRTAL